MRSQSSVASIDAKISQQTPLVRQPQYLNTNESLFSVTAAEY